VGDETDKSKVPKSQGQEAVPKDLQDRAAELEGLQGQSAGRKDQEGAEVRHTSLLSVKVPSPERGTPKP
jgi:hypothetical protein